MTNETINLWLSAGKPLTAVALARLKEDGEVDYDDPLGEHLPEWTDAGHPKVTLRQLLTHTAGIQQPDLGWPDQTWDDVIAAVIETPLTHHPARKTRAAYVPSASWFLLGEVIARITGVSFSEAFRELITQPLGMADTFNGISEESYDAIASRIGPMFETPRNADPVNLGWHKPARVCASSPGSNAFGPIRDLGRFYEILLADGSCDGQEILSPASIAELTARQREDLFDHTFQHRLDWGLGIMIDSNRHGIDTVPYGFGRFASNETFGHGGSQSSIGFADPEHQLVAAWVTNGRPGEPRHQKRNRAINEAIYRDLGLTDDQ